MKGTKMAQTFFHRRLTGEAVKRGVVMIEDDGQDYFYSIARAERAAFKAWAKEVFAGGPNCKRLAGSWPSYRVVQPQ
jgi:hypothetical protein